jgi:hypothetical protein
MKCCTKAGLAQSIKLTSYRVLRKYLNQNIVVCKQFDENEFRDLLCAAQQYARSSISRECR